MALAWPLDESIPSSRDKYTLTHSINGMGARLIRSADGRLTRSASARPSYRSFVYLWSRRCRLVLVLILGEDITI